VTAYKLTLFTHLALGVAALLSYWVAALAKKGSTPHKLAGKVYLLVMIGLLIPAIPLTVRILQTKSVVFGWFLFYLLLITATVLWQGWFSSRHKRDFPRYTGRNFRLIAWANIIGGAAILGLGAAIMQPVLLGFSLVGILGGYGMMRLVDKGPLHPRWWMAEHLQAMLGAGVATHIAFLQIGLPKLLPALAGPTMQTIAWLGPLGVFVVARIWLGRKYLPKPQAKQTAAARASLTPGADDSILPA
jgi:hypothetical protein